MHPTAHRESKDASDKSNLHRQQRNAPKPRNGSAKSRPLTRESIAKTTKGANAPAAHLVPGEKQFAKKNEEDREAYKSPSTGRATKLGRRVEKPQDPKAGGPSGQKDRARHDKKHANK